MINSFERFREPANCFGMVIIMKNEKLDSVLLTLAEYERLSIVFDKTDNFDKTGIVDFVNRLPPRGNKKVYTLAQLKHDLNHSNDIICKCTNEKDYGNDF